VSAHSRYFVTGTDTEIGKTLVSSALLHALVKSGVRAAGVKPVAAGATMRDGVMHNDDVDRLQAASNVVLPTELAVPYLLREAVAPHQAAVLEGVEIDATYILSSIESAAQLADALVVEGVGGFKVPLAKNFDTADLAKQLGYPVIMVVGLRLGCINHALLTADAIAARGLKLAGWVANLVDPQMRHVEASIEAMRARLNAPLLGYIPHLMSASAATACGYLDFSKLADWPLHKNLI